MSDATARSKVMLCADNALLDLRYGDELEIRAGARGEIKEEEWDTGTFIKITNCSILIIGGEEEQPKPVASAKKEPEGSLSLAVRMRLLYDSFVEQGMPEQLAWQAAIKFVKP